MITDTIRESLEGIKAEAHILLSSLPHTQQEFETRMQSIHQHVTNVAYASEIVNLPGIAEGVAKRWLEESPDGKALLYKLVQETINLENSAKVADSHPGTGSANLQGPAITATTTESNDAGITATTTDPETVTSTAVESAVESVAELGTGLGTEPNVGMSGTE